MRRLSLTLLCGLILAPAAFAATRASGDGVLELRAVAGTATLSGKGALWGQLDKGSLAVTDSNLDDGVILVSGADHTYVSAKLDDTMVYTGKDIHFRFVGVGKYKLIVKGTGIDLTAVGVGTTTLTGDTRVDDDGGYSVDGAKWKPVVFIGTVVNFGTQRIATP
jgi:hypothetical protein